MLQFRTNLQNASGEQMAHRKKPGLSCFGLGKASLLPRNLREGTQFLLLGIGWGPAPLHQLCRVCLPRPQVGSSHSGLSTCREPNFCARSSLCTTRNWGSSLTLTDYSTDLWDRRGAHRLSPVCRVVGGSQGGTKIPQYPQGWAADTLQNGKSYEPS